MRLRTTEPSLAIRSVIAASLRGMAQRGISAPVQRDAVPATDVADIGDLAGIDSFVGIVEEQLLLTRLPGARRTPMLSRILRVQGGGTGHAVVEGQPIPATRASLDLAGLRPRKFAALVPVTREAVQTGGAVVERGLQSDLARAIADAVAEYLLGDAAASDAAPAGLAHGVTPIDATGDPVADIREMFEQLGDDADPASLAFITDSKTATRLGTVQGTDGGLLFPNVGATGGEILGVPVLISRKSPRDGSPATGQLLLVDGSAVDYAVDGVTLAVARSADILMTDDPENEPTRVGLFQAELEAFRTSLRASWKVSRPGAVSVLTGIDY